MKNDKQKTIFTVILSVILISVFTDLIQDHGDRTNLFHLMIEIMVCFSVIIGILFLWANNLFIKKELDNVNFELVAAKLAAEEWKGENEQLLLGLSNAIDQQLSAWKLTPSEKDVTLMLLKGLSLKEIAEIRSVSERTVRQQSINIYEKANLSGRAELSAFFLEDLLR